MLELNAPLLLAFTAGLVSTVNPCGFAMLPAYLSYFMGLDETGGHAEADARDRVQQALTIGGVVSLGLIAVFGVAGWVLSLGFREFQDWVPWITMAIGAGLVVLGVAMWRGFQLQVALPKLERGGESRSFRSVFLFGASYAVASLSCTLPVFIIYVSSTFTRENVASGLVSMLAYGLGVGLVLTTLTLALALAKHGLVRRMRSSLQYVNRASAVLLVVAGTYLVYYWALNLGTDAGTTSGPLQLVERLSATATERLGSAARGIGITLGLAILAALAYVVVRSRRSGHEAADDHELAS